VSAPAVLLVEDEAAVQRFVDAALEDLGIALHVTDNVADALARLQAAPFALVLTDLMLGGASGRDLVLRLQQQPALGAGPRVAVLSAGLTAPVRADLLQLGAWRLLDKPVPVEQLRQCVREAIGAEPRTPMAPPASSPADVVQTYFGGNARIYQAYRATCEQQFPLDLAEGERAYAAGDRAAMRRLAHNLKTVLLALGHAEGAHSAKAIDAACLASDWSTVQAHWPVLRSVLQPDRPEPRGH
jgi:CheY-like chemotaxis protein/HPt (histidine-containing phosphotransfer) domain-containing protein